MGEPLVPGGRPTKYDPESHPKRVYRLGLLGLTEEELGIAFGVSHQTLANWYAAHPEFLDARSRAREEADSHVVESLYWRARGYEHEAVKIFMPSGATEPVYAKYTERYPPDTQAAALWLSNRQGGKWKLKSSTQTLDKDGNPTDPVAPVLNVTVARE